MTQWIIHSISDVEELWRKVREVPRRTNGRTHHREEQYCLGLYLLALGRHGLLNYPFVVKKHESSDFVVTEIPGEVTGLEVTRATEPRLQRKMTSADRELQKRELAAEISGDDAEPGAFLLSEHGWLGDEAEKQWCILMRSAIERKLAKLRRFATAARPDLLIYDDIPLPAVDRRKVMAALDPWARDLKCKEPLLGRISIVISLDVLFDVGGKSIILPFVQWSDPGVDETPAQSFSEQVALAGRVEAERAIREPAERRVLPSKNTPAAYYVDTDGHIIKRTAEGRRFEVRIKENGSEVVIRELRSA